MLRKLSGELSAARIRSDSVSRVASQNFRELSYYRSFALHARLVSGTALQGTDQKGAQRHVDLGALSRPLVLYTLDAECPYCIANLPFMNELAVSPTCGSTVLGISVGDTAIVRQASLHNSISFPVLLQSSGSAWQALPLGGVTPTTIAVGQGGRLLGWWIGTLGSSERGQIANALLSTCETVAK